jgi:hypothetical protein
MSQRDDMFDALTSLKRITQEVYSLCEQGRLLHAVEELELAQVYLDEATSYIKQRLARQEAQHD